MDKMAVSDNRSNKYRDFLYGEGEKNTVWRFGAAPSYEVVDKLFEDGRTKVWPSGSLEEKVQNLVKTYEMEMMHKLNPADYKSMDPNRMSFSVNGEESNQPGRNKKTRRKLQFLPPDVLAGGNARLQSCRGNCRDISFNFHYCFPSWFCIGDSPGLLRSSGHCFQVQALGIYGGSIQRSPSHWEKD
ncbi:Pathogen-related protein [Linum perenne]